MKKKVVFLLIIFLFPGVVFASGREEVSLSKCVDGDTAKFIINNKEETVRFLAVDTPATKHPTKGEEPYGKEASDYTCNRLKEGNKIELEYDDNSTKTDKYNRYLAWVFVDDNLLQAELVKNGLAGANVFDCIPSFLNSLKYPIGSFVREHKPSYITLTSTPCFTFLARISTIESQTFPRSIIKYSIKIKSCASSNALINAVYFSSPQFKYVTSVFL